MTSASPGVTRLRANVLGVGVDAVDMEMAVQTLFRAAATGAGGYVCVTGVHGVMESQRDEALRLLHNQSLLTTPDGMPTVWVGRLQGHSRMRRVYGPDLMLAVCAASSDGSSHYLLGGGEGVAEALAASLRERFPRIRIIGAETPPFRPYSSDEEASLAARLNALSPTFCWIGLSTPKQERLAARLSSAVPRTIFLCVGAAFDIHAGRVRQAPRWIQRTGFEWLFRLAVEPRRLWRRYLRNNPEFILRIALQFISTGRSRDRLS